MGCYYGGSSYCHHKSVFECVLHLAENMILYDGGVGLIGCIHFNIVNIMLVCWMCLYNLWVL